MPRPIPAWVLNTTPPSEHARLSEYRLDGDDVVALFGKPKHWLGNVLSKGLSGWRLAYVKLGAHRHFRMHDLIKFSKRTGLPLDLSALHPGLQLEWKMGPVWEAQQEGDQDA